MTLGFRDAGLAHVRIERISAETLQASAGPSRPAAPASDETSSYAICSYGTDRVEHLRTNSFGDRAAPLSSDALGCENFRLRLVRLAESTDDLAPVAAALTKVGSSGVERAESIPVSGLADMEAAESALSDQFFRSSLAVVASGHEQPVPLFQQLARDNPSGGADVREVPAVAAQRRGSLGRARDRHQP